MQNNEIKSLVAIFAHNIISYTGLSRKDIAEQIEYYYSDVAQDLEDKIRKAFISITECPKDTKIDELQQIRIMSMISLTRGYKKRLAACMSSKDYEIIEIYKDFYEKFKQFIGISVTNDDRKYGSSLHTIKTTFDRVTKRKVKQTGFSVSSLEQFSRYWLPGERKQHLIEGFLNGFLFADNNKYKTDRDTAFNMLFDELQNDDLSIIFTVKDRPEIVFTNRNEGILRAKLKKTIRQAHSGEMKSLLFAIFQLLKEYDKCEAAKSVAKEETNTNTVEKISRINYLDEAALVIDKFIHEELFIDEGIGITGVNDHVMQEILTLAFNDAMDDFKFICYDCEGKVSINNWISKPNVKALITYRFYKALMDDPRCHTDRLINQVWTTFWNCCRNYGMVLHPYSKIKAPVYIGKNAVIFRNSIINRFILIGNEVSIIPCRTTSSHEYSIRIEDHSYVGNCVSMKGDFVLEAYSVIEDYQNLWDTVPCSSKDVIDQKINEYIKSVV